MGIALLVAVGALPTLEATPLGLESRPAPPPVGLWFVDRSAEAGVVLVNASGSHRKTAIIETTGSGACFLDFDLDEDLDLYLVNGAEWETHGPSNPHRNALYRNVGGGRFEEATAEAGVGDNGWGGGCAVGDYDNDGDPDLYVTNYGANVLYRNEGDGTLVDVTARAGVGDERWSAGAVWVDIDADGDLDLYVANYLRFGPREMEELSSGCFWKGAPVMCGPRGLEPEPDTLYRNDGGDRFTDVSATSGIAERPLYGLGVVAGDVDGDGDQDLLVANDSQENSLHLNDGRGAFDDHALIAGVALSGDGRAQAGMGIDLGDFDGDGDQDLLVTNFSDDYHTLYRNDGDALFTDVSLEAGLDPGTRPSLGWGGGFYDLDNDGDLDILLAGGHVYPQVDEHDPTTSYRQRNLLLRNDDGRRFVDVSSISGPGLSQLQASRGLAVADYDDDGDLDAVVVNDNDVPSLLRNEAGNRLNWLKVRLIGRRSNRDGIGTRLRVETAERRQYREVRISAGYSSSHDPRTHFGLGRSKRVDRLVVSWPSGLEQVLADLPVNRLVTVDEEEGLIAVAELGSAAATERHPSRLEPGAPDPDRSEAVAAATLEHFAPGGGRPLTTEDLQRIDLLARSGTRQILAGGYDSAIQSYRQALALLPAWEKAAASPDALGFGEPSRYRRFLSGLYDNLGVALMRAERLEECAVVIERALEILPDRAKVLHNLGLCHLHGRRYPAAITALVAAAEADPQRQGLHYDLGRAFAMSGRCEEASTELERAIRSLPRPDPRGRIAESWYLLGGCREASGDLEAAAEAYRETLTRIPGHQKALYKLQSAWRRAGRTAAADAAYELFRRRQPIDEGLRSSERSGRLSPANRLRLAHAYLDAGLPPEALLEAKTAAAGGTVDAVLLVAEASLALRPPDLETAEEIFARILSHSPANADALAGLGRIRSRAERDDEAEELFRRALAAEPGHAEATVGLARLLVEDDVAGATAILHRLLVREPENRPALVALTEARLAAGDAGGALAALERAGGLYGEGIELRLQALLTLGDADRARAALETTPFLGRDERHELSQRLGLE